MPYVIGLYPFVDYRVLASASSWTPLGPRGWAQVRLDYASGLTRRLTFQFGYVEGKWWVIGAIIDDYNPVPPDDDLLEGALFLLALALLAWAGRRNALHNFAPLWRSRLELFVAALPLGAAFAAVRLPVADEMIVLIGVAAVAAGLTAAFALPPVVRYLMKQRNPLAKSGG